MNARRLRAVLALSCVPLVGQCDWFVFDACYVQQIYQVDVGALTIVPDTVQSAYKQTFRVQALLWDQDRALLPEFLLDTLSTTVTWLNPRAVNWDVEAIAPWPVFGGVVSVAGITPNAHQAAVSVGNAASPWAFARSYRIIATSSAFADTLLLKLVPRNDQLFATGISAAREPKTLPAMAVLDGGKKAGWENCQFSDAWLAFVRLGHLGSLADMGTDCIGHYAIFSEGRRAIRDSSAGGAITYGLIPPAINAPIGFLPVPPPSDSIGVVMWLPRSKQYGWLGFVENWLMYLQAANEFRLANRIYERARSGLGFKLYDVRWLDADLFADIERSEAGCAQARDILYPAGGMAGPMPGTMQALHLIHVLYAQPDAPHANTDGVGVACTVAGGPENLVLIFLDTRLPTTLAHEFGHHLLGSLQGHFSGGPEFPGAPMCSSGSGKPEHNLMASGFGGRYSASRHHLTIGQVFKANYYRLSYIFDARIYPAGTQVRQSTQGLICSASQSHICPPVAYDPGWAP